jgi:DNA-binding NarL/FixJ family response regulator
MIRLLVVDDHEVVRRSICSLLKQDATLEVVCQTASGEDSVTKAAELQPDLILMDISLPGISGIEAARQIRTVSPESQIIFLSQHDAFQMVKEALRHGHGYVTKIDAASQLLEAIKAVRAGNQFVSRGIGRTKATVS